MRGLGRSRQLTRVAAGFGEARDLLQPGGGLRLPEHLLEKAQLERSLAGGGALSLWSEHRVGFLVTPPGDRRAPLDRHHVGISKVELVGHRVNFVVPPFDERANG